MKQCILILLLCSACAKTQTSKKPGEASNDCKNWDTTIDSSAEFLCAIEHAPEKTELIVNKASLVFLSPLVVKKSFRISSTFSETSVFSGPAFTFEKFVNFDTISFNTKTIRTQAASFKNAKIYGDMKAAGELSFENVAMESPLDFNGRILFVTGSTFLKPIYVRSDSLNVSTSYFEENVKMESPKNAYINNNVFLGKDRETDLLGPNLFVENNCRNASRKWTHTKNFSGNRAHKKCAIATWFSINESSNSPIKLGAYNPTHIKVGDFNGDGVDELVRINENAWHRYDFKSRKWSLLRIEKNTPPWAIGVADLNGDGKDSLIKEDGYLIRILSEDGSKWLEGEKFEEGFARQYLMVGNIGGDKKAEFVKYDRKTNTIFSSRNDKIDWKEEATIKDSFKKLELVDYDGDGFDDLILHQLKWFTVYDFTKKIWKKYPGSKTFPTIFGNFDNEEGKDIFIDSNQIIKKKTRTVFKNKKHITAFVADRNGDGIDEIFSTDSPKEKTTIATYNVNHAGFRDVEELGLKISRIDADLIVLQEVDRNTKRNPYDMVTKLVAFSGYKYFEFFKSNDYQGGEYGLLVLSKSPIKNVKSSQLPAHENIDEWPEKNIAVSLESGDRKFIVTHIIARKWKQGQDLSKTQDAQMLALTQFVKKETPDFVLGDFNIKPDSDAFKNFLSATEYEDSFEQGVGITFPDIHGDPRRIDYVFSRPDLGTSIRAEIPAWISSDHYPYVVHFD